MKNNYLVQAWLVLLLALSFGAALAGVQTTLNPRIQANKQADTMSQIPDLVPGAVKGEKVMIGEQVAYKATDASGKQVGWVLVASGQGFADVVELLIGLDMEVTRIMGLYVLDQKETPGLGNRIVDADWRDQFEEKAVLPPLAVVKREPEEPNQIEGVTGATISSDSVVRIVNSGISQFRKSLSKQGQS